MFTLDFIKSLFRRNNYPHDFKKPIIIVYRNTNKSGSQIVDTGTNNCDTILLLKGKNIIKLQGRSYPADKYQKQMVEKLAKANYIASGYYENAWRKGYHRGYRALRQNIKFMIWCSDDMDLLDDDDWNKYQVVGDNFHGWAPGSAGCVTVQGGMKTLSGDWKTADNWIYNTNKDITYFSAAIFQYEDLITKDHRLRIGSKGEQVKELQKKLNKAGYKLKIDGDFGPVTHHNLRQYQQKMKIGDNGIYIIPPEAEKAPKKGKAQKTGLEAILKAKSKTELLRIVIKAGIITDPASNKADILKAILDSYTKAINGLDKSYRKIELSKINLSSTEAMKGITQNDAVSLAKELSIKSIKDLGRNKHFQNARIISVLSDL